MWKKGTYHYERCVVCGQRIRLLNDNDAFPVPTNCRYDHYILKAGPVTALQAGNICRKCLKKPVDERVYVTKTACLP